MDEDLSARINVEIQRHERLIEAANALLPAWFIGRMLADMWSFGLLLVTGKVMCIRRIVDIHKDAAGTIWLDVEMDTGASGTDRIYAPTSRTRASVNASHVVAAFELADT